MSDSTHIKDLLTPEEYKEHQALVRKLKVLDLARSDRPLTVRQLAELLDLSPATIQTIETAAKHKLLISLQSVLKPSTN